MKNTQRIIFKLAVAAIALGIATSARAQVVNDRVTGDLNGTQMVQIGGSSVPVVLVPEEPTLVAGLLLLLPFGAWALRSIRHKRVN